MEVVPQGDFGRVVRGGTLDEELVPVLRTMWTQARSAALRVHRESVEDARAYLRECMAQHMGGPAEATARSYTRSFETYVEWDATAYPAEPGAQVKITFAPDGVIRGRADMVFLRGPERCSGRLLLWDDLPMDREAAEIIALPSLRAVEQKYGDGTVAFVEVWQLATRQPEQVDEASAAARDDDVHRILRELDH
jgi:hypothetical protein